MLDTVQGRLDKNRFLIVSGFSGIGKSELIKQFIWKMREGNKTYKRIIWLAADSESVILSTLHELVQELKLEIAPDTNTKEVWKAIVTQMGLQERWLVVFDNLEDISIFRDFVLDWVKMHVIITTRHSHGLSELSGDLVQLDKLDTDEAVQMFRMQYTHQFGAQSPIPRDDHVFTLVRAVGNHPAAICHVVTYLRMTHSHISDWLRVYKTSPCQFLMWETFNIPSLASKLSTSFLRISENTNSVRLLCLLSFFQSDHIPKWLLRQNPWLQDESLQKILRNEGSLNTALEPLSSWSLVSRHSERSSLSMHKIAQAIMRVFLDYPDVDKAGILRQFGNDERSTKYWTGRAAELLYPLHGQFMWRKFADQDVIAEHTRSCLEHCQLYNIDSAVNKALLHAFSAIVLFNLGERHRSDLWREPLHQYQNIQGGAVGLKQGLLCHFISLRSLLLKKYDESQDACQNAIRSFSHLVDQDEEWGLQCQYQLGSIQYAAGNYDSAGSYFQNLERTLFEFHGDAEYQRVVPLLDFGRCLLASEHYDRALEVFETAVDVVKKVFVTIDAPEATECALPLMLIGSAYVKREDSKRGLVSCDRAIGLYEKTFAESHPKALLDLVEHIGLAFQALGEHGNALVWFGKVKSVCDNLFRSQSVLCANTLENAAVSICCTGEYGDALREFEKVEELLQIFANRNESRNSFKIDLDERITRHAETLRDRGRYHDAICLRKCALLSLDKPPYVSPIHKARQQKGLADLYQCTGDFQLAEMALTAAVEVLQIAFPYDHQEVVQSKHELRKLMQKQEALGRAKRERRNQGNDDGPVQLVGATQEGERESGRHDEEPAEVRTMPEEGTPETMQQEQEVVEQEVVEQDIPHKAMPAIVRDPTPEINRELNPDVNRKGDAPSTANTMILFAIFLAIIFGLFFRS